MQKHVDTRKPRVNGTGKWFLRERISEVGMTCLGRAAVFYGVLEYKVQENQYSRKLACALMPS